MVHQNWSKSWGQRKSLLLIIHHTFYKCPLVIAAFSFRFILSEQYLKKHICSDVFTLLVLYFLLVRDWLIDEQALRTQYCFVWRDTSNSWNKMVSFLHDLHKFCFSLHILFVKYNDSYFCYKLQPVAWVKFWRSKTQSDVAFRV